jgi:hypothetical protein
MSSPINIPPAFWDVCSCRGRHLHHLPGCANSGQVIYESMNGKSWGKHGNTTKSSLSKSKDFLPQRFQNHRNSMKHSVEVVWLGVEPLHHKVQLRSR